MKIGGVSTVLFGQFLPILQRTTFFPFPKMHILRNAPWDVRGVCVAQRLGGVLWLEIDLSPELRPEAWRRKRVLYLW